MATKPMTAADYAKHAESARRQRPTEIVTLKSGSVFELRRPDLQAWVMTGRVPQSLLEEGLKAWQTQGKVDVDLSEPKMISDVAIFSLNVVQACTVNPRLVEFPDPKKNQIGPETMLEEDFHEIFNWAMTHQGVASISGLRSFRQRSKQRTAGTRARGKKLQPETVGDAVN